MGSKTDIEWTDATWSPIRARVKEDAAAIAKAKGYTTLVQVAEKMAGRVGPHCEHASHGCDNCYAETNNHRCLPVNGTGLPFDRRSRDLVEVFVDEKILMQPLRWKTPKRIFVENQSDLFGEWVGHLLIGRAFGLMAEAYWHTFQVLTKRAARLLEYSRAVMHYPRGDRSQRPVPGWPPNVWLGVSVEDQKTADERIPLLLRTPAAKRFVSYEPALGPVDFGPYLSDLDGELDCQMFSGIDWVIAGGESGPGARPAHPDWFRSVRDQCQAAGVSFFFKQHGNWVPTSDGYAYGRYWHREGSPGLTATSRRQMEAGEVGMKNVGKKAAGALLDGREWKEFPA